MYFVKTPNIIRSYFKDCVWNIDTTKKEIYLTFDDGPTPQVTSFVLNTLKKHQAKATFFCIGKNIEKHPDLFNQIIAEGHAVANHTQNHDNGWKTNDSTYIESVTSCQQIISNLSSFNLNDRPKLFRPPYGKIKRSQIKKLNKKGYKILMWTVLSGDFDSKISKEKCLNNAIKKTKKGDIVVFHDSEKAFEKLKYTLPKVLEYFSKKEFEFKNF